jgi:hypothetical protein
MNLPKMIAELRAERDRLDQAILALERLSISNAKRRGRPTAAWKLPTDGEVAGVAEAAGEADSALS